MGFYTAMTIWTAPSPGQPGPIQSLLPAANPERQPGMRGLQHSCAVSKLLLLYSKLSSRMQICDQWPAHAWAVNPTKCCLPAAVLVIRFTFSSFDHSSCFESANNSSKERDPTQLASSQGLRHESCPAPQRPEFRAALLGWQGRLVSQNESLLRIIISSTGQCCTACPSAWCTGQCGTAWPSATG